MKLGVIKTAALACTLLCTALFAQQKGTFTDTRDGRLIFTAILKHFVRDVNYQRYRF